MSRFEAFFYLWLIEMEMACTTRCRIFGLTANVVLMALSCTALAEAPPAENGSNREPVYFGTYTSGASEGIYLSQFDPATGQLSDPVLAAKIKNPSFLALHPHLPYLYAVSEVDDFPESKGGAVAAFSISAQDGRLRLLNYQSSQGAGPCHLTVDHEGANALVANYGGGSVAVLPIAAGDGTLQAATAAIQHRGSSIDPRRQEGPHAHSINLDGAGRFAFVADLGLDQVLVYRFDAAQGTLVPNEPPGPELKPGSGPRHFAFHPNGQWAYVINELASSITAYRYDSRRGTLDEIQTVSTLPADAQGDNTTAEIQVHPTGKFLYGSNRGHDSIAMFGVDPATGRLSSLGNHPTGGRTPRNFGLDPQGKYLLVANQNSDSVTVHRVLDSGRLESTGLSVAIPSPVCVRFGRRAR